MEGLKAILDLKLDISIKNRKKLKFNGRHQFKNPFAGNTFEFPQKCLNHANPRRYQCKLLTCEDALNFRNRLYRTDEKRDQNDFLYDYIKPESIRSNNFSGRRLLTNYYSIEKISGETIQVCQELFQAITGFGIKRCKVIFMKRYKVELLEKIDSSGVSDSLIEPKKKLAKGYDLVKARKEKLFKLEAGTLETFTKAITGVNPEDNPDASLQLPRNPKKKPNTIRKSKIYKALKIVQDSESTEFPEDQEPERNCLNLAAMEGVCRICFQTYKRLIGIFRKSKNLEYTPAELMQYCLSIPPIDPNDNLPKKICVSCLESVKIACNLKNEWTETQNIMEEYQEKSEEFKVPEIKELLTFYSDTEDEETEILETVSDELMLEDIKSEPECESDVEFVDFESMEESGEAKMETKSEKTDKKLNFLGIVPRKCYLCDVSFGTTPEDHFVTDHPLVKVDRCTKCLFECDYPWFMNCHMQVHLDDFKLCPHCGVKFQVESSVFSSHKMRCSGRDKLRAKQRTYTCKYCSEVFKKINPYTRHVRTQHTFERPYKCTECDQTFLESIHLRRHLFKHGIGATCHCENCGKPYLQRYELTRHQKNCYKKTQT